MNYSLIFLMLAASCVISANLAWDVVGWFVVLFLYTAFTFLLLVVAYAGAGPGLLFKRESGRRSMWGWVLFGPYFLLNAVTFGLYRMLSVEPAYVLVTTNIYFGRRLSARECTEARWVSVLDLAVEFEETGPLRRLAEYRSLPVLDTMAPTDEELRAAVAWLVEAVKRGPVYIHCALGHGRSACVVIGYLLAIGEVGTVGEGVRRLRKLRPGVRLHRPQRLRLQAFEPRAHEGFLV